MVLDVRYGSQNQLDAEEYRFVCTSDIIPCLLTLNGFMIVMEREDFNLHLPECFSP